VSAREGEIYGSYRVWPATHEICEFVDWGLAVMVQPPYPSDGSDTWGYRKSSDEGTVVNRVEGEPWRVVGAEDDETCVKVRENMMAPRGNAHRPDSRRRL
jgi:hypothetical protein